MARPQAIPTELVTARLSSIELAAVDRVCRESGITRSEAVAALVRQGWRESLREAAPLEPCLSPNAHDGLTLEVAFRREDHALCETILALLAGHMIPDRKEMH
jgi:hypothetical protein